MSFQIGNLDLGVSFVGDTTGLTRAMGQAGGDVERFGRRARTELGGVGAEARRTDDAMSRLATGIKGAFVGGSVAVGLIALKNNVMAVSSAIIDAQVQLDRLTNGFHFGAGGAEAGAREMAFLREEVSRLGLDLGATAGQYMKLVAASRGNAMQGEKTRELFTAIAEASVVMGLGAEQSERAMMAVTQMMSKGKVMAEELRGQLGEHLPGAFSIAARAMGVTEVELNKLMETGQVMSADFLPKFAAQMRKELAGSVEQSTLSMQASLNRFSTAWLTFKQEIAQSGVGQALANDINAASGSLSVISRAMEQARKDGAGMWGQLANGIGAALGIAAFGSVEWAAETLNGAIKLATGGVVDFGTELNLMPENLRTTAEQTGSLAGQIDAAKQKVNELEVLFGNQPESPYLRIKLVEARALAMELERAKIAADALDGKGENYGNETRREDARQGDMKRLEEQTKAVQAFWQKNMTPAQKMNAELATMKASLGTLFTPDIEAQIRKNYTQPVRGAGDAVRALKEAERERLEALKEMQTTLQKTADMQDRAGEAYLSDANALMNANEQLRHEIQLIGLDEVGRRALVMVKERELIADKELLLVSLQNAGADATTLTNLEREINLRQQRLGLLGEQNGALNDETARLAGDALRKAEADAWAKTWDQVSESFADALMQGGKSVSEYLKGLFRTLVLRPILAPIGAGMASLFGAPAAAGQGGGAAGSMDALSSVGSLYNAVSNGVSSSVTAGFTKLMSSDFGQKIGMSYYDGNAYQLTGTGQSVGSAMGMAGNAMAGYGLQKAISGGYEVGNGNLVDAITIAASAYFGPIAGAVAGVFNRAFGRKLKDVGIEGSFGGEEGFAGQQYQFYKGGWLRSDKTKYSDMDAGMATALGDQFKALQMQTGLMATALGQGTDAIAAFTQDIKISFKGLSEEQIAQKLQEQFAGVADNLANLVLGETDLAKAGETAAQTLGRLASSLTTVNAISDTLGWALQSVSLAGGAAASTFADLFGGLDKMAAATSSYYDAYYTESERTATATRQLTTQLAALGVALPASRDAYRDLIDNALTSGNQQLAADLIMLSGAFAALSQSTDDLAAQATSAAQELASAGEDLRSALAGLLQPLLDAVASARAQASGAMATVAGLPGPTLQQLRDQVAAQQVTLPSAAGVLGAQATADAAYLRLADTQTATAVYQRQADSASAALQAAVAQSAAAATAFGNTKTSIVAVEAAENAAFAKLGYAYGGGFTVNAEGKPVWSSAEMNGQSRWAKSLGGGWNASLGAYEGPAALAAMRGGTAGQWNDYWSSMGTSGAPTQDPNAPWNRLDALSKQYGTDLTALTKAQAAQTSAAAAQAAASAKLTAATTARAQAQAAVDAATAAQAKAQAEYAAALRGYVADASKAVDKLSDLREQTVAYYEAQKQLADGMTASAQRLREAAQAMRFGQLSAAQSLAQQRQQFDRQYTLALSTGGMVQAGYADQLASSLPALSESIKATSTSRADWATATARLFAQSQTVAAALEANAPKDYQTESLAVLTQIDGTLAAIEAATSSAEKIISDAIFESGDNTLAGLRAVIAAIKGETIPAFALGGTHLGGLRLVGENGPELEATGPSRIYNASQTRAMLAGGRDDSALVTELQALRSEVQALRAEARATAINTGRTQDLMKRVTRNGEAMQTEAST